MTENYSDRRKERKIRCDICFKMFKTKHPRQMRHDGQCARIAKIRITRRNKGIRNFIRKSIKDKKK